MFPTITMTAMLGSSFGLSSLLALYLGLIYISTPKSKPSLEVETWMKAYLKGLLEAWIGAIKPESDKNKIKTGSSPRRILSPNFESGTSPSRPSDGSNPMMMGSSLDRTWLDPGLMLPFPPLPHGWTFPPMSLILDGPS